MKSTDLYTSTLYNIDFRFRAVSPVGPGRIQPPARSKVRRHTRAAVILLVGTLDVCCATRMSDEAECFVEGYPLRAVALSPARGLFLSLFLRGNYAAGQHVCSSLLHKRQCLLKRYRIVRCTHRVEGASCRIILVPCSFLTQRIGHYLC